MIPDRADPLGYLKRHIVDGEVKAMLDRLGGRRLIEARDIHDVLTTLAVNVIERYDVHIQNELRLIRLDIERREVSRNLAPFIMPVVKKDPEA